MGNDRPQRPFANRIGLVSALALSLATGAALIPEGGGLFSSAPAHAQAIQPSGGPASFSPVVKAVAPAVVHIEVTQGSAAAAGKVPSIEDMPPGMREFFERFFGGRMPTDPRGAPQRQLRTGLGSGFVIDAAGHVVTNNHVIASAEKIIVTMKDGEKLEAKLVGADSRTDLALLKVERRKPFPYVAFGDSDKSEVGDWVVAVGNPFGLDHTVTTGIISARGRSIGAGPYDDFLQIDAPINKGNSGGPAFNLQGEVIGVNTAIFSPTGGSVGIGFAIPANLAKNVIEQLKGGGAVQRGWLGVSIQTVSEDIATGVGLEKAEGAIVSNVAAGSPGAKGGLRVGDVILAVNDERIEEMPELPRVIASIPPNSIAKLAVWRDRRERTLNVKLGTLPSEKKLASASSPEPVAPDDGALGLTLAPLDSASKRAAGVGEDVDGVLVADVAPDSPLAAKGVTAGSVLLAIAGTPVTTPSRAAELIKKAKKNGRSAVLLLMKINGNDRFVAAPLT
jgi:serine protease Do